ncbi:MAG: helix-turn-helix domain-containing protein [Planctomycetota bacterium]
MSQIVANYEVLTLEEAASYLRVAPEAAEQLATHGGIPARRIRNEWRFLRSALDEWLRGPDYKQTLLGQAGALKDDSSLDALRDTIYTERGRPEVENSTEG